MAAVTVTLIYWLVIRFTGNAPLFSCHSISNEYNVPVYKKGQYTKKVLSMCLTHPISAIYSKSIIFRFLSVVNNNVLSSHLLLWWNNRPWFLQQTADSLRSPRHKGRTRCVVCVVSCLWMPWVNNTRPNQTRRDEAIQWRQRREREVTWLLCLQTTVCICSACRLKLHMDARQGGRLLHLSLRCEVPYSFCYILFPFFKL